MKDSMEIKLEIKSSIKFGRDTTNWDNLSQYMGFIAPTILYRKNALVDMDKWFLILIWRILVVMLVHWDYVLYIGP